MCHVPIVFFFFVIMYLNLQLHTFVFFSDKNSDHVDILYYISQNNSKEKLFF